MCGCGPHAATARPSEMLAALGDDRGRNGRGGPGPGPQPAWRVPEGSAAEGAGVPARRPRAWRGFERCGSGSPRGAGLVPGLLWAPLRGGCGMRRQTQETQGAAGVAGAVPPGTAGAGG